MTRLRSDSFIHTHNASEKVQTCFSSTQVSTWPSTQQSVWKRVVLPWRQIRLGCVVQKTLICFLQTDSSQWEKIHDVVSHPHTDAQMREPLSTAWADWLCIWGMFSVFTTRRVLCTCIPDSSHQRIYPIRAEDSCSKTGEWLEAYEPLREFSLRGSPTFQSVTPKITVPETRDPTDPGGGV